MKRTRRQDFHDLMQHRVMDVLLVSSPYDWFVLEEAGQISEHVRGEFRNLDLHYGPGLTPASSAAEALALARNRGRFQLIVTSLYPGDQSAAQLAASVRDGGLDVPVVGLAFDTRELADFTARHDVSALHRLFLWQGDARILLAIVKDVEDGRNAPHDVDSMGVQVLLVVEDSVRYYSSFLPVIYAELLHQSQRVLADAANVSEKITRMRARPKILLCTTFEEARRQFERYREDVLGVISDVELPQSGEAHSGAGLELARLVRQQCPDVPVLLHSARAEVQAQAQALGADFLQKGSPLLLQQLRQFMTTYLGFGDFVFRTPAGRSVGRATDLKSLEAQLRRAPIESVCYHAERNHFSRWLKARTEFALAQELRPWRVGDFGGAEPLRDALVRAVADYRGARGRAAVGDFDRDVFDGSVDFCRIGDGSLGGKARGLAFFRLLLSESRLPREQLAARLDVPETVVVGTDVFDQFMDQSGLRDFATLCTEDADIEARFLEAPFPEDATRDLEAYLAAVRYPIAVRSSSLLEDSRYQPFSGVYDTFMLSNDDSSPAVRVEQLLRAIKRVYASTFSQRAKSYIRATPYRLEEEKMAVVLQRLVGSRHGDRFYPDLSLVARSHDFYPPPPLRGEDGVVAAAFGLGRTVVEGGTCVRFSPRDPLRLQASSVVDALRASQRMFWALELGAAGRAADQRETRFGLEAAEADGTLGLVASTWSAENDALYDGVARAGVRLVTLAPLLKDPSFPVPEIVRRVLDLAAWGMAAPVEVECAVTLGADPSQPVEVGILQLRPLALYREREALAIEDAPPAALICRSDTVLGNGRMDDLRDVVVVDPRRFERDQSRLVTRTLARVNAELIAERRPYVLIGVGRWGSRDPWLGIPVAWEEISGARIVVEAGFRDLVVTPSQGTHFFHNLTAFNVGYFTVNASEGGGFVDWDWLAEQPAHQEHGPVRHIRFDRPAVAKLNGHAHEGVIFKPGAVAS